jgi:hypothetical protein
MEVDKKCQKKKIMIEKNPLQGSDRANTELVVYKLGHFFVFLCFTSSCGEVLNHNSCKINKRKSPYKSIFVWFSFNCNGVPKVLN